MLTTESRLLPGLVSSGRRLSAIATAIIAMVCAIAGFWYFSGLYQDNETRFSFYQKYFHSALNLYCVGDPDIRYYNLEIPNKNERIDLNTASCTDLSLSTKHPLYYWNGWHDIHPIFSTLVSVCWRWLGLDWNSLWPIAGLIGGLTILAYYVILRCFGLPWHGAALLLPLVIPFNVIGIHFYYLRDYSKVPFILLSFGIIGLLFDERHSARGRGTVIAMAISTAVVGMGFRQDAIVILPTIVTAIIVTTQFHLPGWFWRIMRDLAIAVLTSIAILLTLNILKTTQVAQLEGYPHFLAQGFADPFWQYAQMKISGLSFLSFYSDMLAWSFVDANSAENVGYFVAFDPNYTTSGFNLVWRYSGLAAPEMILRVFWAWSSISHTYWMIKPVGFWLLVFMLLIILGRWRLGLFLAMTCLSLVAAGSLQFDVRHNVHLIMMDRVLLVIAATAIAGAGWNLVLQRGELALWQGPAALGAGLAMVYALLAITSGIQRNKLDALKESYASLPWIPYTGVPPTQPEMLLRIVVSPDGCNGDQLSAQVESEGQKAVYTLPRLDGRPRPLYFVVFNGPAEKLHIKVQVNVVPSRCIQSFAWTSLAKVPVVPVQFFDPEATEASLKTRQLWRRLIDSLL